MVGREFRSSVLVDEPLVPEPVDGAALSTDVPGPGGSQVAVATCLTSGNDKSAARQDYPFEIAHAPLEICDVVRVGGAGKACEHLGCIVELLKDR